MIICYPASYFWYWWSRKSLIGMADPIHHHIFAMWVMIWMKERSNIYAFAMSQRWHQYGGPSWICQNHAYVFLHCRYLDLLVCPLCIRQTQLPAFADKWYQRFFWSSAGFLPKLFLYFSSPIICIFRQVISTFVVFFTAHHQNSLVQLLFTHPFLQSDG